VIQSTVKRVLAGEVQQPGQQGQQQRIEPPQAVPEEQQVPQTTPVPAQTTQQPASVSPADLVRGLATSSARRFVEEVGEPAAAIGTGLLGQSVGGLAGLASLPFVGPERSADIVNDLSSAITFEPRSEPGRQNLENIGRGAERVADAANFPLSGVAGAAELATGRGTEQAADTVRNVQEQGFSQALGDRVFEDTGSPLVASLASVTPEIAASAIPVSRVIKNDSAFKQKLADEIRNRADRPTGQGPTAEGPSPRRSTANEADDETFAKKLVEGQNRIRRDKEAIETIKQGFDQGVVAAIKGASSTDRAKMRKMLAVRRKGEENKRFAAENRPADIAGETALERVNFVKQVNREAGRELNQVAKSLDGPVNIQPAVNSFLSDLQSIGVQLGDDLKPRFKGSDIEGLEGPQRVVNQIVRRMHDTDAPDAFDAHRLKRFIDENVSFGKTSGGLSGRVEGILKNLRRQIDGTLDSQFPRYNEVNQRFSETREALDAFQDAAGTKVDLFGQNADKAVGTVLRRLMSNTQSRANMLDSIRLLNNTSKKFGAEFDDDIVTQMLFADELDSKFGPVARTSFQGQIQQGVQQSIRAATGQESFLNAGLDTLSKSTDRLRGINKENAFNAMDALLSR